MADGPTTSGSNEFRLPRIIDRQAARLKQADFAGRATELDDLAKVCALVPFRSLSLA
jgi:hypothetical protein